MKILSSFLQLFPVKLLIIVGYIFGIAFMNWLIDRDGVPVSERCSPDYPDFAVELEYPQFLPDGEVLEESSGEIYPQGAWWMRGKEIWGCPCSLGKPCLRKCCALGEDWKASIENEEIMVYCRKKVTSHNITASLYVYEERYAPPRYDFVKVSPDHFKFYHKKCHGDLDFTNKLSTRLVLFKDGTLRDTVDKFSLDQSHFCVEYMEGLHTMFYYCDKIEEVIENLVQAHDVFFWLINITSVIILMFTLLVYTLVPRLRRGYGKPIMCYLATQIVSKLNIVFEFFQRKSPYSVYQFRYFSLSVEVWAVVVSYNMRSLAGSVKARPRFLLDCGLAWGAPLVLTVVSVVADLVPGVPDIAKPQIIGKDRIKNNFAKWLYYIFPMMALEIVNLVLCVATLVRLAASKRNVDALQGPDSSRHNASEVQWSVKARPRFLLDCGLAWGAPLVLTVVSVVADLVPGVPDIAKPQIIGKDRIKNNFAKWLYYIFPMMALEIVNLVLRVATLVRLAASKRNVDALQGPDSSRHNASEIQWLSLYIKVCLILGINYLIYNILYYMSWIVFLDPIVENTLNLKIASRGIEVFIIFVCKKDILYSFYERLAFWRK